MYLIDQEPNFPEDEKVRCRQLPWQRPVRQDEASSTPKPPGGTIYRTSGEGRTASGAAGYKAGRPSSYAVRGVVRIGCFSISVVFSYIKNLSGSAEQDCRLNAKQPPLEGSNLRPGLRRPAGRLFRAISTQTQTSGRSD
jgi:hypothetical protein